MRFIRCFNLSEWCLKIIIENLKLFVHNKTIPQKHIDFLLRVYSEKIFREYCSLNTISEDYMLWFLNPHNRKITLSIITEKVFTQLQVVGTTVTELNLRLSLATENILNSIICCVPHLKYLDLSSTSCSDKTLLFLERMCPELILLNLKECEAVSDQGMINLCDGGNLSLYYLDIIDTEVGYDGLRIILTGMPTLECLKYNNLGDALPFAHEYEFVTDTYKNIQYNLTELRYEGTTMCDDVITVILMWTVMCPKVKKVHFLCSVTEEVVNTCARFKHLEELRIETSFKQKYVSMVDVITPMLPIASSLKTLILSCVKIPVVTLLENFVNLKCLFLNNVQFTDSELKDIKITETKLDTLIIKDNNFQLSSSTSDAIAVLISLSKNVTKLRLNCTGALHETIFHIILRCMKKLTFIDLSYCSIKMNLIINFFEIPSSRQIYLDLCNGCFSFEQYCALKNIHRTNSPCTLAWQTMTDDTDDSDSDVLSDG